MDYREETMRRVRGHAADHARYLAMPSWDGTGDRNAQEENMRNLRFQAAQSADQAIVAAKAAGWSSDEIATALKEVSFFAQLAMWVDLKSWWGDVRPVNWIPSSLEDFEAALKERGAQGGHPFQAARWWLREIQDRRDIGPLTLERRTALLQRLLDHIYSRHSVNSDTMTALSNLANLTRLI
jgi:hypothetical protein